MSKKKADRTRRTKAARQHELKSFEISTNELKDYANNSKIHDRANIDAIKSSIQAFGMCDPIGVWRNPRGEWEIVEGHGRKMALEELGIESAPCVDLSHLTDEERRAYSHVHNQTTLMTDIDLELAEIDFSGFDMGEFGFKINDGSGGFFESAHRFDGDYSADDGESAEYNEFVAKFEPKRTTDDCYTPDNVYDAVADFVAQEYGLDRANFVRPFYPGGDYQNEKYPDGCVVVDNPPFSILAEIKRFYSERRIKFFLFAPTLTIFGGRADGECSVCVGVTVTYDNGARVNTSFATNLDKAAVITAPRLYEMIKAANDENERAPAKVLPKYIYPDEVITAAMVARWCKYGVEFRLDADDCEKIPALDSQREKGKAIFGSGFLLSERAAAERAAAERAAAERAAAERAAAEREAAEGAAATKWALSEREREIIARLGNAPQRKTD